MVSVAWKYSTYVVLAIATISLLANLVLLHLTSRSTVAILECREILSKERKEYISYLTHQQQKMNKVTDNQVNLTDALFRLVQAGKSVEEMRKFNQFAEEAGACSCGIGGPTSSD